jgi:raffinose/stachyose/melibiose transport system permease protein
MNVQHATQAGRARFWFAAFTLPGLAVYTVFWVIPALLNFAVSLFKWSGLSWNTIRFVGLANFARVFHDRIFYTALWNNLVYVTFTMVATVILSFLVALLVERGLPWKAFFRTTIYLPVILPLIVTALLWRWIYNPAFGLVNPLLEGLGLGFLSRNWLGDPKTAMAAVMGVGVWKATPFFMVVFIAALQKIPAELEEAATIDGASPLQTLLRIIIPLLKPVINIVIALNIVRGFRVFALVYAMTNAGPGRATEVLPTYIVRVAFEDFIMGYAAALSVLLFFLVFGLSLVFLRPFRSQEEVQY